MEWSAITIITVVLVIFVIFKLLKFATKFILKAITIFIIFLLAVYVYDSYLNVPEAEPQQKAEPNQTIEQPNLANVSNATAEQNIILNQSEGEQT